MPGPREPELYCIIIFHICFHESGDERRPVIMKQHDRMCFNIEKPNYHLAVKFHGGIPNSLQMGMST